MVVWLQLLDSMCWADINAEPASTTKLRVNFCATVLEVNCWATKCLDAGLASLTLSIYHTKVWFSTSCSDLIGAAEVSQDNQRRAWKLGCFFKDFLSLLEIVGIDNSDVFDSATLGDFLNGDFVPSPL